MSTKGTSFNYKKLIINPENFSIIHKINPGRFGCVYTVQDNNTGEKYAAKIMNLDTSNPKNKQEIIKGILIMIRCQHPTIISFHGYSFQDFMKQENMTIFMKLAENGSLADLLGNVKKDHYDNTNRQIILIGIARGMMHLHQHHIIHCDLKPENVLLDSDLHPYLTDFCISKIFERISNGSRQLEVNPYMSPEMMEQAKYNGKADVYSFGILMYEIITDTKAYPLFEQKKLTTLQFTNKVINENYRPEFKVKVKKSIQNLIERCWEKDPNSRPTFEEIFNMLSYNIENSNSDIYSNIEKNEEEDDGDDDSKYYLDGIGVEEVISYADSIQNDDNSIEIINLLKKLHEIEGTITPLREENEKMKNDLKNIIENEIDPLKNENDQLKQENIDMKNQIEDAIKSNIDPLMKENEEIKKENQRMKDQIEDIVTNNISQLMKENSELKKENQDLKTQIEDAIKGNIDPLMKENQRMKDQLENLIQNSLDPLKKENSKLKKDNIKIKTQIEDIIKNNVENLLKENEQLKIKFSLIEAKMKQNPDFADDSADIPKPDIDIDQITIKEFNSLSIQVQQSCISDIISKSTDFEQEQFFRSIDDLLSFILKFVKKESKSFIEFFDEDEDKALITIDETCQIHILSNAIETLFLNRSLHSPEFAGVLLNFKALSFKLVYPSTNFDPIYNIISNLRKSQPFNICVFITKTKEVDSYFKDKSDINFVEIDISVSRIQFDAFSGCTSLERIIIPPSVSNIGQRAFYNCKTISQIKIPNSIYKIENGTFEGCTSLVSFEIPPTVKSIGSNAFNGCWSLIEVTIPKSVTSIGDKSFDGLKILQMTGDIEHIPDNSFKGCKSIEQIIVSSSVQSIGNNAFSECTSLSEIVIPDSVMSIGKSALSKCTSLKQITIPSSIDMISEFCFDECTNLFELILESIHTKCHFNSFNKCSSFSKLQILSNAQENNEEQLFEDTNIDESVFNQLDGEIQKSVFSAIYVIRNNQLIKAEKNVQAIEMKLNKKKSGKFNSLSNSDRKELEKRLKKAQKQLEIEKDKFVNAQNAYNILFNLSNIYKKSDNNNQELSYISITYPHAFINYQFLELLDKDIDNSQNYDLSAKPGSLKFYLTVQYPSEKFDDFIENIKNIICSYNKSNDYYHKSYYNESNANLNICLFVKDVESTDIDFLKMESIKYIKFDSTVKRINGAFDEKKFGYYKGGLNDYGCIEIPKTTTYFGKDCFNLYRKIDILGDIEHIPYNLFRGFQNLNHISFSPSIKTIGDNAFRDCSHLIDITFPNSLTYIGNSAFKQCEYLEKIYIPASVTVIDQRCFEGCTRLTEIKFESFNANCQYYSFNGCSSLNSLQILSNKQTKNNDELLFCETNINSKMFNQFKGELQKSLFLIIKEISDNRLRRKEQESTQENTQNYFNKNSQRQQNRYQIQTIGSDNLLIERKNNTNTQRILEILLDMSDKLNRTNTQDLSYISISNDKVYVNQQIIELLFIDNATRFKRFLSLFNDSKGSLTYILKLKYPSENFENIYNNVISFKDNNFYSQIHICIFITEVDSTDARFKGDKYIEYVELDSTVEKIPGESGEGSFEDCRSLREIVIPDSVKEIGPYAFNKCISLKQLPLPPALKPTLVGINSKLISY